jgi:hypothetical protein
MVASSDCPIKWPAVCHVGGAWVAEVALACAEGGSGVICPEVVAAPWTRKGAIAREASRRAK